MNKPSPTLPRQLKPLFWEYDFRKLAWPKSKHTVIAKVLSHGTWEDIRWLRTQVSDDELRKWIYERHGRMLTPRQLTYWRIVLDLPRRDVAQWLAHPARQIWDKR
ncbi:MAG: hypothetical protein HC853_13700 [Anaerolineae bacterium]|nr:hypothetical protein [Anaerolineae bacterium]